MSINANVITSRFNSKKITEFCKRNVYLWLAFFIPLALMLTAFALMNVSPFGTAEKQVMVTDQWHQYYPFLADFQNKLQHGESLFWTWSVGSGVNYFSLMSYYVASPMNLFSFFVSPDYLREFLMISISVKIAFAGCFMALFLRSVFKRNDMSIVFFGICFSFCAYFMGYYWNNIWLDTVAITPLVALGAIKLLTENRFRLYTITLALSLITNYYIGFFTCIFVLLIFICYHLVRWQNFRAFGVNVLKMLVFTILGIGLAAFFILPAFMALQNTHASGSTFPKDFATNIGGTNDLLGVLKGLKSVTGNLVNFTVAANKEIDAMPNIACGAVPLFFAFLSLTSKQIKLREKLVSVGLILFMFLSFIIRQLDYVWHGFHFPNMIYYRFSYLVSFVIIVMAFRAFMHVKKTNISQVIIAALLSFSVLLMEFDFSGKENPDGEGSFDQGVFNMFAVKGHNREDRLSWVIPTLTAVAIIFILITALMVLYTKRVIPMQAMAAALLVIVVAQSGYTAYFGVNVTTVTGMKDYPRGEPNTAAVVDYMYDQEKDNPELWRAEVTSTQTLNDGALNHYRGLSMFNSMANETVTIFYENFGMNGWQSGNRFLYFENSPVTNMFMNLKYLIARNEAVYNTYDMSYAASSGNIELYKNNHYLPMGFVVDPQLKNWSVISAENTYNPIEQQSEFFRLATGIEEPVYSRVEPTSESHTDASQFNVSKRSDGSYGFSCVSSDVKPHLQWDYKANKSGLYLVAAKIDKGDNITVLRNGSSQKKTLNMSRLSIGCAGYFKEGETLSLKTDLDTNASGSAKIYVYVLNQDVFEQGYNMFKQNTMTTTYFRNGGKMEGTINSNRDGLFYTSIPYEKGWRAYVDGEEVDITPIGNCMLAFDITKGEHEIVLKYLPHGFIPGLIVSILCLLGFIAFCVFTYIFKRKLIPDWGMDKAFTGQEENVLESHSEYGSEKAFIAPEKQEQVTVPADDIKDVRPAKKKNANKPFVGSTLFLVASIIMTIGGALSLLISIGNMRNTADMSGNMKTGAAIGLIAALLQIVSGIFGLVFHNKRHDPLVAVSLGVGTIIFAVVSNLLFGNWMVFLMLAWPVLYIIGAVINKSKNK